ncbi:MAG TPA: prepilin-type N-terminal cleavage/methylation domain-containing protein [Planctomycetota bacterium]|nr:prepilin-type N-terminal cleavage/methylation domain-containing protein [Planctomycetota bacterium]
MDARRESGFTLIEALVALMIVAMVVIEYIGIRTTALIDATQARNCRLARELAEEKMSELQAGARETPPESGTEVQIDKYKGFSYKIVVGESDVSRLEGDVGTNAAGESAEANERLEWQRDRENYRKASSQGLSYSEYNDKLAEEDYQRKMAEEAPSADKFEEVAVVVYFPKMPPDYPDQKDSLLIKARLSTLALSNLTPKQAESVAQSKGQTPTPESGAPGGGAPGASGGGNTGGVSGNSASGNSASGNGASGGKGR